MQEEQEVQEPQVSAESFKILPIRLMIIMSSLGMDTFAAIMTNTLIRLFVIHKLSISIKEYTYMDSVTSGITSILLPLSGIVTDVVPNKYYLLVCRAVLLGTAKSIFVLLAFPGFRSSTNLIWTILNTMFTLYIFADLIGELAYLAFENDQFDLPRDQLLLRKYTQIEMIVYAAFGLLGYFISPLLKTYISCFGEQDCYAISFSICIIITNVGYVIFMAGYRFYIFKKPEVSSATKVMPCVIQGFKGYLKNRKTDPKEHWMDHAKPVYGAQLVEDVKSLIRILLFSITIPVRVAADIHDDLLEETMLSRLKLRVGGYMMLPEHLYLGPEILKLVIVSMFIRYLEPRIRGKRLDRPYLWIMSGAVLFAVMQLLSAFLLTNIIENLPPEPDMSEAQIRIYNGADCPATFEATKFFNHTLVLDAYAEFTDKHVPTLAYETYQLTVSGSCFDTVKTNSYVEGGKAISVYIKQSKHNIEVITYVPIIVNDLEPILPIVSVMGTESKDSLFLEDSRGFIVHLSTDLETIAGQLKVITGPRTEEIAAAWYKLYWNGRMVLEFVADFGGIYQISLMGEIVKLSVIAPPNKVHFLWSVPIMTINVLSEYLLDIGKIEFLYMEIPPNLRGTAFAIHKTLEGLGNCAVPLLELDWPYDDQMYFFAFLNLITYLVPLIFVLKMRSRHPGRKLV